MRVLVTGGAGYIGSHACLELLQTGYDVSVVDNLTNSRAEALHRVQSLAGKPLQLHVVDLTDRNALRRVFAASPIDAVMHFAGLKAVGESVERPLAYYHNNVTGSVTLCGVMVEHGVREMIFSSSCTVYGNPHTVPIKEDFPLAPLNPYGRTKLMIESILGDLYAADASWSISVLRYFNPVGAHPSGQIGEDPEGIPNNLFPYMGQVAVGRLPELFVYGNDYPTEDGTGVRDYIHVVDLAQAHLKALQRHYGQTGLHTYNLGSGRGYSVLEVIHTFERVSGEKVPHKFVGRRSGDVAKAYADPARAKAELGWTTQSGLEEICEDFWRWQSRNPAGYRS